MTTLQLHKIFPVNRIWRLTAPIITFIGALIVYWLTAAPVASYWDCPEYITCALRLEIGHPPGNPFWMLTHKAVSLLGGNTDAAIHLINLASGLFTALAAMLLCILLQSILRVLVPDGIPRSLRRFAISTASLAGSLIFAWSDSPWFSAVEAEVYAMSLFLTALTLWVSLKWLLSFSERMRMKWLILLAYLFGLSIGVHQLNLLCIPVVALIIALRRRKCGFVRGLIAIAGGCVAVVVVLKGMMPGMPRMGGFAELLAVNRLGLGYNSGLLAWAAITLLISLATPFAVAFSRRLLLPFSLLFLTLALSGTLQFTPALPVGITLSALAAFILTAFLRRHRKAVTVIAWSLPMLFIGFSSYSLILIRGYANPPMNQGTPGTIFSFSDYLARRQYGTKPLLYGRTPESQPMREEKTTIGADGQPTYSYPAVIRIPREARHDRYMPHARLSSRTGLLTASDSANNNAVIKRNSGGYLTTDYYYDYKYPPELDMWIPRITSADPSDRDAYEAWAGMSPETMTDVKYSQTLDSLGHPAGKRDANGIRHKAAGKRPTYLQNLRYMLTYQMGYMYFRYLMWNFSGRQNDFHSTGELEHGNFITGFPLIDTTMLGPDEHLPGEIGKENPGRNVYFLVPFILGIAGIVWMCRRGRLGRRICLVNTLLFLLTGLAIVFYVNQGPGEPRERDYSYLGSFFAFAIWAGCGILWAMTGSDPGKTSKRALRLRVIAVGLISLAIPAWMLKENYHDHDRSGVYAVDDYAANLLNSLEKDAIIFVQGDNFTFPLWYAQNIKGIRRDVTVVNMAYLATPWYVCHLMEEGENGKPGLALTAPPEEIAYGAYALVRIGEGERPATEALRELYSSDFKATPTLRADVLTIKYPRGGGGGESKEQGGESTECEEMAYSLTEDLGKSPGGIITFSQLAMLDIVATNASLPRPRPIYWHKSVGGAGYNGWRRLTQPTLTARRLAPDSLMQAGDFLPERLMWGTRNGNTDVYIDPVTGGHISGLRKDLLLHAGRLLDKGETKKALAVADSIRRHLPPTLWQYQPMFSGDSLFSEGYELARILIRGGRMLGDSTRVNDGKRLIASEKKRLAQWRKYVVTLPASRRPALAPSTRNHAAAAENFPTP